MSGEIYDIAKRAVHVFINTGSIPYYVAEQVQRDILQAGYVKKPSITPEAIEAAAREMLSCQEFSEAHYGKWEDMDLSERARWAEDATRVLRAAAPYMLASSRSVI